MEEGAAPRHGATQGCPQDVIPRLRALHGTKTQSSCTAVGAAEGGPRAQGKSSVLAGPGGSRAPCYTVVAGGRWQPRQSGRARGRQLRCILVGRCPQQEVPRPDVGPALSPHLHGQIWPPHQRVLQSGIEERQSACWRTRRAPCSLSRLEEQAGKRRRKKKK